MKRLSCILLFFLAAGPASVHAQDYPISPVPFTSVRLSDGFWATRMGTNRTVTIPHSIARCETTGRLQNFRVAGGMEKGKFQGLCFNDSDVYKLIEGASFSLATHPDPVLERQIDEIIAAIAAAQEADGYLYTPRTLCSVDYTPPGGKDRWSSMAWGHELYCAGHLYEAGVAHYQATGKRTLLDVARKNADLICATFGPGKNMSPCGHQEIEIGLVKLFRVTGERKYLIMARDFLEMRGHGEHRELYGAYAQDHLPVKEQREAVGHAVRAGYMYAAMADVAALTGDTEYLTALSNIWEDVVSTKLYITGGVGAAGSIEGYGPPYQLPNRTAYCETCASIALALWNQRMFMTYGDAKYIDVLERVSYNAFLSGVSVSGDRFFYPNPLESFSGGTRSPWFECACCPPNIVRFIASFPGLQYATRGDEIFVNLYAAGEASVRTSFGLVTVTQQTAYPWAGTVRVAVSPEKTTEFTLHLRIPGWAQGKPVPGDLYRYIDRREGEVRCAVNGEAVQVNVDHGYLSMQRKWSGGDVVELSLPMEIRRVVADDRVVADRGRMALERGPLVFCLEGVDNNRQTMNLLIPDSAPLTDKFEKEIAGGVMAVHGIAAEVVRDAEGGVRPGSLRHVVAIPYYAWAHRERGQMTVWPAREIQATLPAPAPTIASTSNLTTSGGRDPEALVDQLEPSSSNDESIPRFHWWPKKGTLEWIQFDFTRSAHVSKVSVYWFDDTGVGECRVPASWNVMYRDGTAWKPVVPRGGFGVALNRHNTVAFETISTDALRIEVQLQREWSSGAYEVGVE